jgi:hypothetical protein
MSFSIIPCDAPFNSSINGDLFLTCHPIEIVADQIPNQCTNDSSDDDRDKGACCKITNAQSKYGKEDNENPRATFAFHFGRNSMLTILRMVVLFMAVVTACHFIIFWEAMILQS